jgi:hypothetical protein
MKILLPLLLLTSLAIAGQEDTTSEHRAIYGVVIRELVDQKAPLVKETIARIYKYDIDGAYDKWFYHRSSEGVLVCALPVRYESTVINFLNSKGMVLDTGSVYRQIDSAQTGCLGHSIYSAQLISYTRAPLRHSVPGILFKKRKATGLSPVLFDHQNSTAFLKLQVFAKKRQARYSPSRIVVLQKRGGVWTIAGVLGEKPS